MTEKKQKEKLSKLFLKSLASKNHSDGFIAVYVLDDRPNVDSIKPPSASKAVF